MVHDVPECTLPEIPAGMRPDETYGEQCENCPWHEEMPGFGIVCTLDLEEHNR